jgi:biotin carboxylase
MADTKIAIVDGYSTGRILATALRDHGARCAHVQSQAEVGAYFHKGFRSEDYDLDLGYLPDPEEVAGRLSRWGAARVVAGTESGVILADTLNHLLGTPGNLIGTVHARRDKALMVDVVRAAGLDVPDGRVFTNSAEATEWYRCSRMADVVVKPVASAGTDNVRFCQDTRAVQAACEAVLKSVNLYGEPNERVLVQERLRGAEYYINTVSQGGVHRVAEMWQYTKRGNPDGMPTYDYEEPVDSRSPIGVRLREFTFRVLDALGVSSSAAHTEVMLTGRGPVLVESGARLGGATLPGVVEKYSGISQTSLFAKVLLDPARIDHFADDRVEWAAKVRNVSFINRIPGTVRSLDWVQQVQSLPSAVAVGCAVGLGSRLDATTDLLSSPGYVYLAAAHRAELERDYQRLREMEWDGLYTG